MGTYYGSWVASDDWRAKLESNWATSDTSVTVTARSGMSVLYGSQSGGSTTGTVTIDGQSWTDGGPGSFSSDFWLASHGKAIPRGHSARSVTVRATMWASVYGATSAVSMTVSVPARPSWAVSYDAAGGSGAPAGQVKWHSEALTLSPAVPTRAGHDFLGWATSASGPVAWAPGATLPASHNAALTLFAVWEPAVAPPSIASASVTRCLADGTPDDEGTCALLSLSWAVDPQTAPASAGWRHREAGDAWPASWAALPATAGDLSAVAEGPFATSSRYDFQVRVEDAAGGSAVRTLLLSPSFFTFDVGRQGRSVGVGRAAPDADGIAFGAALPPTLDAPAAWRSALGAVGGWAKLAEQKAPAQLSFDLSGYGEVLVAAICTDGTPNAYLGSAALPVELVHASTARQLYLGGGYQGNGTNANGRSFACNLTRTRLVPVLATVDGSSRLASTYWYVYAR